MKKIIFVRLSKVIRNVKNKIKWLENRRKLRYFQCMQEIKEIYVNIPDKVYPIYIGFNSLKICPQLLKKSNVGRRIAILSEKIIFDLLGEKLFSSFKGFDFQIYPLKIPSGEEFKSIGTVLSIIHQLARLNFDRNSLLVAFGGGIITDIAGFTAAIFKRGMPYVNIPTTLTAQVDSAIGGKVGVDLKWGKNLIGSFYHPKFVLIDPSLLDQLPPEEYKCGLAEVVKYGFSYDDEFFYYLEENKDKVKSRDSEVLFKIIERCCQIKAEIVRQDEYDRDLRRILNFGHTIGHALEALYNYQNLKHGEAISIGMVLACKIAEKILKFPVELSNRLIDLLKAFDLPVEIKDIDFEALFNFLRHDKKIIDDKIIFILPQRIGKVTIYNNISLQLLKEIIER